MARLQNVAIAGGSGNIGKVVVKRLLESGFRVTALQRPSSSSTFPPGIEVKKVVFDSFESWKSALEGQDAFISFLVPPATDHQTLAADAAVTAGVKRFIPSEWGMNTAILGDSIFGKLLADKITTRAHLTKLAKSYSFFSWTGISTGLWFDWGLEHLSLGFDKTTRTAEIYDSGSERFQTTNLPFTAKAVESVLENPESTANKYITIASFNTSQNEILDLVQQISDESWAVKHTKVDGMQKAAIEAIEEESLSDAHYQYQLLHGRLFRDGANLGLQPAENFATHVMGFSEEDPEEAIRAWL